MKISVTLGHIMQGDCMADNCAIAVALKEAGFQNPRVGPHIIEADGVKYRTAENARKFIGDYDRELPVRPFSFELGEPLPDRQENSNST